MCKVWTLVERLHLKLISAAHCVNEHARVCGSFGVLLLFCERRASGHADLRADPYQKCVYCVSSLVECGRNECCTSGAPHHCGAQNVARALWDDYSGPGGHSIASPACAPLYWFPSSVSVCTFRCRLPTSLFSYSKFIIPVKTHVNDAIRRVVHFVCACVNWGFCAVLISMDRSRVLTNSALQIWMYFFWLLAQTHTHQHTNNSIQEHSLRGSGQKFECTHAVNTIKRFDGITGKPLESWVVCCRAARFEWHFHFTRLAREREMKKKQLILTNAEFSTQFS